MSSLAAPVAEAPATDAAARDRATVEAIRSMHAAECRPAERRRLRELVIRRQLPLARHLARGYADRGEPVEDLVQVAALALVKAVDGFDPERGTSFAAYAYPTILGELKRHFRDRSWSVHVPRQLQERCLEVTRARADLVQRLHRAPTAGEIAEVLGIPEADVRTATATTSAYRADSLNRPVGSAEDPCEQQELLGDPDGNFEHTDDRITLQPALAELPERARHAVCRYFFDNRTQDEIAAELHTSQMSVSRLLTQALAHLKSWLSPSPPPGNATGGMRVYTYEPRQGCLVATVGAPAGVTALGELRDALIRILIGRRPGTLVVDLRRLPQASPVIARALLDTYRAAGHVGARVCVVNVAADLLALLRRTGVARLLPCRGVPAERAARGSNAPDAGRNSEPSMPAATNGSAPTAVPPRHRVLAHRQRPATHAAPSCPRPVGGRRRGNAGPASHRATSTTSERSPWTTRSPLMTAAPLARALALAANEGLAAGGPSRNRRRLRGRRVSGRSRPPPSSGGRPPPPRFIGVVSRQRPAKVCNETPPASTNRVQLPAAG
ncbi:sigma-70 family RNA polymerase sigma factor [Pseudosporangium ferrugineum]|uniref:RNA polymerase sigma-70 factor (Sigma-B/F/G subfamily) n=1 Tax=Pseudosporangium ferrugineum TaxID=439699 RepID=A0A2T0RG90_9ACTN|nr:sigma-70 family RNA polymerase sigma factor [Pseudosporangium ferrugineum]PRY20141.1 RNA polymerase sigma-70 factor (sigma-B/F/G subfamily) [Pseudosporangium ferrugineum]